MSAPLDVVVPIYGAPYHVQRCVTSVLKNTRQHDVRIILADDASPDPAIGDLLARYSSDDRVETVINEKNLGFVLNCNRALANSDRDAVLLNSDTIVGPGWLDRLQRIAYLVDRVGSVTPLSNNAEVCSAPWWFEPNTYPSRITIDDLDGVAADLDIEGPMDLPTGVGFCLYLRRSALDVVGLFDEESFGTGYGEENDLCARMRHGGFLNLLAPNVFVEHVGGGSFAESGSLHENLDTLSSRWPNYHQVIQLYRRRHSLRGIHSRFGLELAVRGRDPEVIRPLFVLHYRTRIGRKGGTEHHTEDLVDGAGSRLDPMVLTYEDERPVVQWDADGSGMSFPAAVDDNDETSLSWVDRILDSGVDLVHVQHPMGVPLGTLEHLQQRAGERGLPVVWSLHDYYTTCPCIQLVHPDGTECPAPDDDCVYCQSLAQSERGIGLRQWRERFGALIGKADMLVCPTETAAEIQSRVLELHATPTVIPHGLSGERVSVTPPARSVPRVVVMGYNAPQKGGEMARELTALTSGKVEWVFLGRDHLDGLRPSRWVRFAGTYERDDLPGILDRLAPDAIALLSNWHETYLYTLSEAWRSGIPVFGTDLGAMAERIHAHGGGVLIHPGDSPAAAATIIETLSDAERMDVLRRDAHEAGLTLPTVTQMADRYVAMYGDLVGSGRRSADVTHPVPSIDEWAGWLGTFPAPFPSKHAYPLRVDETVG